MRDYSVTALQKHEEGIHPNQMEIIKFLHTYISSSNFMVLFLNICKE
jgi:hypothetical protein